MTSANKTAATRELTDGELDTVAGGLNNECPHDVLVPIGAQCPKPPPPPPPPPPVKMI
jgi:hypothetical protein